MIILLLDNNNNEKGSHISFSDQNDVNRELFNEGIESHNNVIKDGNMFNI